MMKIILFIFVWSFSSCGTRNAFDCSGGVAGSNCSALSKEEEARKAMDTGDFDAAIELLNELINEEPTNYKRHPLLSAAYAARSGFDILNIATADFGSDKSLLQSMSSFLPTPITRGELYDQSLIDMQSANATLLAIPEELRASTSGDKYATSAVFQLTLYQGAYGVMLLNKFTYSATAYDPSLLSNMTDADAQTILDSFAAASAANGNAAGNAANSAISSIQTHAGSTDRERIAAWSQAAR